MINMTKFAVATNDSKPILTGELFEIDDTTFKMAALDGYRLAVRKENTTTSGHYHFVIRAKSLNECVSLIKEPGTIKTYVSDKNVTFEIGKYSVFTRLMEGEFHNYNSAIPTADRILTTVSINSSALVKSLERAQLFTDEKLKSPVHMNFTANGVSLYCKTAKGEFFDEIDCDVKGNDLEIGFNGRYLADAIKSTEVDRVILKLINGHSPMIIEPTEGDSFLFLVLPIRLH
jgi:DNA polymerase-3 subunit beta